MSGLISRRTVLTLAALAPWSVGRAASPKWRIALLLYRGVTDAERGFMEALSARIAVDFTVYDCAGDTARLAEQIAAVRAATPDLVYTFGTTVTLAAVGALGRVDPARHLTTVPVVCNIVADPVGSGLVQPDGRSGRNLTGVSHLVPMSDQLRAIQQLGTFRHLGVLYNRAEPNAVLSARALEHAAPGAGFILSEGVIDPPDGQSPAWPQVEAVLGALLARHPDLVYLPSDSSLIRHAGQVVARVAAAGLPVFSATEVPIRNDGAWAGLVSRYDNAGRFAAYKALQILLEGRSPARLPVETLKRFSLIVNMRTAHALRRYPGLDAVRLAELVS
jgi:putative ABC transport system substrate-binding protein